MKAHSFRSVGLCLLVIASFVVAGGSVAVATDASNSTAVAVEPQQQTTAQNGTDGESVDLSGLSVTALEAAEMAQNETGGKVIAVRLRTVNGTTGYEVLVANESGNVTGVVVDAQQSEIIETRADIARLNLTVLQQQGSNYSDIRGAVETIKAARRVVEQSYVPVEVAIEAQPGFVGQQVTFVSPTDTRHVVVDLTKNPVIGVGSPVPRVNASGADETTATTAAMAMGAGDVALAQEEGEGFGEGFGVASEYPYGEYGTFGEGTFAENDEFDTGDGFGLLSPVGGEEEAGAGGLFGGEDEREEGGGFLGEENEGGWF